MFGICVVLCQYSLFKGGILMPARNSAPAARGPLDAHVPPLDPAPDPDASALAAAADPSPSMGHSGTLGDTAEPFDPDNTLGLDDLQIRAIQLTVLGHGDVKIAEMLGVSRKTLWRWKTLDDDYRRVLEEARRQIHAAMADRIQVLLLKATAVLAEHLDDPKKENQFRAAQVLLMMAGKFKPSSGPLPTYRHDQPFFPPDPEFALRTE
jgi:hypothetical protein